MLGKYVSKGIGCHAGHQEVDRCCTRGESEEYITHRWQNMYASEGIHLVFDTQGRGHQKPKTGEPVAPRKGINVLQKFYRKRILWTDIYFKHQSSLIFCCGQNYSRYVRSNLKYLLSPSGPLSPAIIWTWCGQSNLPHETFCFGVLSLKTFKFSCCSTIFQMTRN